MVGHGRHMETRAAEQKCPPAAGMKISNGKAADSLTPKEGQVVEQSKRKISGGEYCLGKRIKQVMGKIWPIDVSAKCGHAKRLYTTHQFPPFPYSQHILSSNSSLLLIIVSPRHHSFQRQHIGNCFWMLKRINALLLLAFTILFTQLI
jgi:hypothetical protein